MQRIVLVLFAAAACLAGTSELPGPAESFHAQGVEAYRRGDPEGAGRLLELAAGSAASAPLRAKIRNDLGAAYYASGSYDAAAAAYRRALADWNAAAPGDDRLGGVATTLNNLAVVERRRAQLDDAEALARRALALIEPIAVPAAQRARIQQNLAEIARLRGPGTGSESVERAEQLARIAWTTLVRELGEDHPEAETARTTLAFVLFARGRSGEAEEILEEAGGFGSARALEDLAQIYRAQGRLAEAEPVLRRVLAIRERPATHSMPVARALKELADLFVQQGKDAGAEKLYRRALAITGDTPSLLRSEVADGLLRLLEAERRTVEARRVRSAYLEGIGSQP